MSDNRPASSSLMGTDRGWLWVAILAIGLALLSRDLTGRFTGKHEFNSAIFSIFGRNHLRYGLSYTKLFCTWGEGPTPPTEPHRYLNHPPLIAVWTAGVFALLGDHEWAARLAPVAATLGSAALLMTLAGRLTSPAVSVLAGLFYLTLPVTSYFGRVLDHVPLVQFFSLLMLHGYLQWSGRYGTACSRPVGAACYAMGAALGIGTGWGAAIMAALIALLHIGLRLRRRTAAKPAIWWLLGIPAMTLAAVLLHILWGLGWDVRALSDLFLSRTTGSGSYDMPGGFLVGQWHFLLGNYSWAGVLAIVIWTVAVTTRHQNSEALGGGFARIVFAMLGLHGLIYVLVFPGPASHHEYWQALAAPFVAIAIASVILMAYALMARRTPRAATVLVVILVIAPMPGFMFGRDRYYRDVQMPERYLEPLVRLRELVGPGTPVMTSRYWPVYSETFGRHVNRWGVAQILYYADRPLVPTQNLDEITANSPGCSAYVLELLDDPQTAKLEQALSARYRKVRAGEDHLIFLLGESVGSRLSP